MMVVSCAGASLLCTARAGAMSGKVNMPPAQNLVGVSSVQNIGKGTHALSARAAQSRTERMAQECGGGKQA